MKKLLLFSIAGAAVIVAVALATLNVNAGKSDAKTGVTLSSALEGKLVRLDEKGDFEAFEWGKEKGPEFYAIYFSAHWCGPCREFTPTLVSFYEARKKVHDDFELIFVSSDVSEDAMRDYMREAGMKWPALKYSERNVTRALTKFAGPGIPCLVVLDANGEVVAHTFKGEQYMGPETPMRALEKLLNRRARAPL